MMQLWSPDHIRFMEDASLYGSFHRRLAEYIRPHLPHQGRLCDVGCGLGHLSLTLSPYCREITACDIAGEPLDILQKRAPENLTIVHGDIRNHSPALPYDGMIFCLFGNPEEILAVARRQCCGPVVVIQRADTQHRFASADALPHQPYSRDLSQLLSEENVPFQTESISLEFGQPFRSREDVYTFFSLYSQKAPLTEEEIFSRLVAVDDHPDFTLYLPLVKRLTLTVFHVPPKKHLFLTGEKGVGKSTLLRNLLRDKEDLGGFLTVRKPIDNKRNAVYMHAPQTFNFGSENLLFICGEPVNPQRFDKLGCRYLMASRGSSILVMDELGPKECEAKAFQTAVFQALDGNSPVYGVIQKADTLFLQKIRNHPHVQLVHVTPENRDMLLKELKKTW